MHSVAYHDDDVAALRPSAGDFACDTTGARHANARRGASAVTGRSVPRTVVVRLTVTHVTRAHVAVRDVAGAKCQRTRRAKPKNQPATFETRPWGHVRLAICNINRGAH